MYFIDGHTPEPGETGLCSLFTLARDWNIDEVNWNNADANTPWENTDADTKKENNPDGIKGGGDWNPGAIATSQCVESGNWQEFDITTALQNIVNNPNTYYGFAMKPYRDNQGRTYASSEVTEVSQRPKLTVTYEPSDEIINIIRFSDFTENVRIDKSASGIQLHIPYSKTHYTVSLHDVRGRELFSTIIADKRSYLIPLNAFSSGIHILNIRSEGKAAIGKYIITR